MLANGQAVQLLADARRLRLNVGMCSFLLPFPCSRVKIKPSYLSSGATLVHKIGIR
jgi:hypothetical protein